MSELRLFRGRSGSSFGQCGDMSSRRERPDGINFYHGPANIKRRRGRRLSCLAPGKAQAVTRRKVSSVPVGAVVAALAVIAVIALFVLYLGGGSLVTELGRGPSVTPTAENQ
jgi:hypothetical protein